MMVSNSRSGQQGAVLVIGLIMLGLITVLIVSAFSQSVGNLRAVGNMQSRDEAIAAGDKALEQVLSSPFTNAPAAEEILVDINNDGTNDYRVSMATPACITAGQLAATNIPPSSSSLGSAFNIASTSYYQTTWELVATVSDMSNRGATAEVHEGVRVLLTGAQYTAVCT
jgi:Tfp pilus assembly protein PilX